MYTNSQLNTAIQNLDLLIEQVDSSALDFSIKDEKLSKNVLFKAKSTQALEHYLQELIHEVEFNANYDNPLFMAFFINLQYFFNLVPNKILQELNLDLSQCPSLQRNALNVHKYHHTDSENRFKDAIQQKKLPEIRYDLKTGLYTSPDDDKAHQHGIEARHIFISTQLERIKAWFHGMLAKVGIYVFESATYQEREYLESDIYKHDTAIRPDFGNKAHHYWVGHATSLITIPTDASPLHVLTDPVEGDLAPLLYPRMTKEGLLIDGQEGNRLPKIDVVLISHNHRDHLSESTLKRLVKQQPKMIVPEGDVPLFIRLGFQYVVGLKWWEQASISDSSNNQVLNVTAVPARHWSGRGIGDAHASAFNGYVLSADKLDGDVYFAGDTALMDDTVSHPIFEQFNIVTSIQPGGPDEGRKDMESTHQSSADAILMHFKILTAHYQKQELSRVSAEDFLNDICKLKTIYNHTATFKLGNLRLKDSFYCYQRIIAAFKEGAQWSKAHLPAHEQKVVTAIRSLADALVCNGQKLTDEQIVNEILRGVVIPKIGQRQPLYFTSQDKAVTTFGHRELITNGRALKEFDGLLQNHLAQLTGDFSPNQLVCQLLEAYQHPWHASLTRSFRGLKPYIAEIKACQNNEGLLQILNRMESHMGKSNQQGHMQSVIHYAKWILEVAHAHPVNSRQAFDHYFACQQVRKLADQAGHSKSTAKQKAFQELSEQLAELALSPEQYRDTIAQWLHSKSEHECSVKAMLGANRSSLFARSKTYSEDVVEQMNACISV